MGDYTYTNYTNYTNCQFAANSTLYPLAKSGPGVSKNQFRSVPVWKFVICSAEYMNPCDNAMFLQAIFFVHVMYLAKRVQAVSVHRRSTIISPSHTH